MQTNIHFDGPLFTGTVGGTSLVLFLNLSTGEVMKTIVLGVIGAIVSFLVSMLMQWMLKKVSKK